MGLNKPDTCEILLYIYLQNPWPVQCSGVEAIYRLKEVSLKFKRSFQILVGYTHTLHNSPRDHEIDIISPDTRPRGENKTMVKSHSLTVRRQLFFHKVKSLLFVLKFEAGFETSVIPKALKYRGRSRVL